MDYSKDITSLGFAIDLFKAQLWELKQLLPLNGHEFEQALEGGGQGNLVCCSPWGCKESDTTEQLINNPSTKYGFCKWNVLPL